MTQALSEGRPPSLNSSELQIFYEWARNQPYKGVENVLIEFPDLIGFDGRQDFPHFWFYSLLATPFWILLSSVALPTIHAFTLLNIVLLAVAVKNSLKVFEAQYVLLVLASPILWYIDKAHTEVFSYSLIVIGVSCAFRKDFLKAAAAFALASTQNVPWLPISLAFCFGDVFFRIFPRELTTGSGARSLKYRLNGSRVSISYYSKVLLIIFISLVHPIYYWTHLGVLTPQFATGAADSVSGLPSQLQYFAVILDPDMGLIAHWPFQFCLSFLTIVGILIPFRIFRRMSKPHLDVKATAAFLLLAGQFLFLLFSFAKTTNFNSGASLGISRYALWLMPFSLPILSSLSLPAFWESRIVKSQSRIFILLASPFVFFIYWYLNLPSNLPRYVFPSRVAIGLYNSVPCLYQPLPEVFVERRLHREINPALASSVSNKSCSLSFIRDGVYPPGCSYSAAEKRAIDRNINNDIAASWIIRSGSLNLCKPRVQPVDGFGFYQAENPLEPLDLTASQFSLLDLSSLSKHEYSTKLWGFGDIESDGLKSSTWRWGLGPESLVLFGTNSDRPSFVMEFEFLNLIDGQSISLVVNGETLEEFRDLGENEVITRRFEIDAGTSKVNTLRFQYERWNHLKDGTFAIEDPRPLAVSFSKLSLQSR